MAAKLMLAFVVLYTYTVRPSTKANPIRMQVKNFTINFNESTSTQFQDCLIDRTVCSCEMESDNFMFNMYTINAGETKPYCNITKEASRKVCKFNIFNSGITLRYVQMVCQPTQDECIWSDTESSLCWPVCWTENLKITLTNSPYGNCFLKYKMNLNQTSETAVMNGYTLTSGSNHATTTNTLPYVQHTTLTDTDLLYSFKDLHLITYTEAQEPNELKTSAFLYPTISSLFIPSTKSTPTPATQLTNPSYTSTLTEVNIISYGLSTVSNSNLVHKNTEHLQNELSLFSINSLEADLNRSVLELSTSADSSRYLTSATGQFQTRVPVTYTGVSSATVTLVPIIESNNKNNKSSNTLYDQVVHASDNNNIVIILSVTLGVLSVCLTVTLIVCLIRRKRRHDTLSTSQQTHFLKNKTLSTSNRIQRKRHLQGDVEIKSSNAESTKPDIISRSSSKKTSKDLIRKDEDAIYDSVEYDFIEDYKSNDSGPLSSNSNSNGNSKFIIKSDTVNPYAVITLAFTQNDSLTTTNVKPSKSTQFENKYFFLLAEDASQNASDSNSETTAGYIGSKINSNSECETVSADSSFNYMISQQLENSGNPNADRQFPYSRLGDINRSFEDIYNYEEI